MSIASIFLVVMLIFTGDLLTNVPLDREYTSLYIVPVVARDGGGRAGFAKVRVNVADQGDQIPKFTQEEFRANVYSTSEQHTHVINVRYLLYSFMYFISPLKKEKQLQTPPEGLKWLLMSFCGSNN